jgi:23S rRNA-/tRNA-specific pseudouridylate synthase
MAPKIKYVYKDSEKGLFVVNKPAGLCTDPHPEDHDSSVYDQVLQDCATAQFLHRIDLGTSGLVLCADTKAFIGGRPAHIYIQRNWHWITRKTYLALIETPKWTSVSCDRRVQDKPGGEWKYCRTTFTVLQSAGGLSLVQCELIMNGRKHQIRKHLAYLGSPIIDDWVYGGKRMNYRKWQLLHAWKLSLQLPGQLFEFQAPVPEDFKRIPGFDMSLVDQVAK